MELTFWKYHGAGNDFVMVDNRDNSFVKKDAETIKRLCDRNFGIGSDGLISLENDKEGDFEMVFYNASGYEFTLCGNGSRCIVAFARYLGVVGNTCKFRACDGMHNAEIFDDDTVAIQIRDVEEVKVGDGFAYANTGSRHHVELVNDLKSLDVLTEGRKIRDRYGVENGGSSANFAEKVNEDTFNVRTYEQGADYETLACGTGVTAVAICMNATGSTTAKEVNLNVKGGKLKVSFDVVNGKYTNIHLKGPAQMVFKGTVEI